MTKFSKKFCAKSPFKSGLISLGRVLMSPRANTSRFTKSNDGDSTKSKYSLVQAGKDIGSGKYTKKEAFDKYKKSFLGKERYA